MRIARLLAPVVSLFLLASPAVAAVPTQPFPITAYTNASASQVQADFFALYDTFNAKIDSTNISPSFGIGANYITATGGGATGTFRPGAYTMQSSVLGETPLVIKGASGQTSDILDLKNNASQTVFGVAPDGATTLKRIQATGDISTSTGNVNANTVFASDASVSTVHATGNISSSAGSVTAVNVTGTNNVIAGSFVGSRGYSVPYVRGISAGADAHVERGTFQSSLGLGCFDVGTGTFATAPFVYFSRKTAPSSSTDNEIISIVSSTTTSFRVCYANNYGSGAGNVYNWLAVS